ncbi:MAG TPA: hypothetical protein V6C65_11300, partial [Allocoleopsis sp.]
MTTQPRSASTPNLPDPSEDTLPLLSENLTSLSPEQYNGQQNGRTPPRQEQGVNYSTPITQGSAFQWFYDMPVRGKQLLGLLTSEAISIAGLVGVGSWLIVTNGHSQLVKQAEAELAVTEAQYNVKVNQMGFGFRGQSDNAAIIAAAKAYNDGQVAPETLDQVEQILKNEV